MQRKIVCVEVSIEVSGRSYLLLNESLNYTGLPNESDFQPDILKRRDIQMEAGYARSPR